MGRLNQVDNKILVIGGYGQVGRYVTSELLKTFPNKVVVAGRSLEKAKSFSQEYNGMFETLKLDIYDFDSISAALINIKIVVMCLSPNNNDFANRCIDNNIHYIDISPSNDIAQNLKKVNQHHSSTFVLGVGIAPGLSNLLVKKLSQGVDNIKSAKISLLLGLGEEHGKDGIKWLLDNIHRDFDLTRDGEVVDIKPFISKNKTNFIKPLGRRNAYSFNLADQFIVPHTLQVKNVSSYFCYDSKMITVLVGILKRIGVFSLLKYKATRVFIEKLFTGTLSILRKLKIGTNIYSIQIDAVGTKNGRETLCHIGAIGHNNSSITGKIAAFTATEIYNESYPFGVYYFEELFSLEDIMENGICPKIEMQI